MFRPDPEMTRIERLRERAMGLLIGLGIGAVATAVVHFAL